MNLARKLYIRDQNIKIFDSKIFHLKLNYFLNQNYAKILNTKLLKQYHILMHISIINIKYKYKYKYKNKNWLKIIHNDFKIFLKIWMITLKNSIRVNKSQQLNWETLIILNFLHNYLIN